ncbi:MAG: IS110 family transposase, partial [Mycobacterium sp.]
QGEVAAARGGWILITWCLARTIGAAFGLACMRFVGIRCEGPAGVTPEALRCLKRRLARVVYHHLHTDHQNRTKPCQPAAA